MLVKPRGPRVMGGCPCNAHVVVKGSSVDVLQCLCRSLKYEFIFMHGGREMHGLVMQ